MANEFERWEPGPYRVIENPTDYCIESTRGAVLADCWSGSEADLFAAAPDLYAALAALVPHMAVTDDKVIPRDLYENAKRALSRARGEEPQP